MSPLYNVLLTNSTGIYAGGEFYVFQLAKALQTRGHKVWVCSRPDNLLRAKCDEAGVPTIPLDFPPQGRLLRFVGSLKKIIDQHRVHIVHTNSNYDRTAGAFAARLSGAKHVTNVHSFHSLRHNVTHVIRNSWATDHFIVDGICVRDMLVQKDRIPGAKISVVYLGVDPEEMKRDESRRIALRTQLGYAPENIVIGNVARLVPFKGHEYLLAAFARLSSRYPDIRLLLIGDGELRQELAGLATSLGIGSRVTFAGFRDDLTAVYSAFDVYVHPSIEGGGETFPFAVLQALSQELPVVVTRVGDVAEMVEEGVNGYAIPEKDPSALAAQIACLLENNSLRSRMGHQSRELLLRRFTTGRMVDGVEKIYRVVAG
jgi:glycosyltransferase involved in cell wall biosynthesis